MMQWKGVMPALTTCFNPDLSVDHKFMAEHCRWLIDHGCTGIVALGSLGEGATLNFQEKLAILETCVGATGERACVVASISALSTKEAEELAKRSAELGCRGLMVLPPYVYPADWREMKTHLATVFRATRLPCMLYNNPVAYGFDFLPEHIRELTSEHENLRAVKESSTDVRRVTAIRVIAGERLEICVGVDDAIVEAIGVGATGWVAGLVNALPAESIALFDFAINGRRDKAFDLYQWFLPLLRMDTVPKFVQLIKLVQKEVGMGNTRVRPPRLELDGDELQTAQDIIRIAMQTRPEW
ncbi:MAG: dihydrodipicolinate synthase family protein [Pyrinomonadaceae bacterium]